MIKKPSLLFLLLSGAIRMLAQTDMSLVGLKSLLQTDLYNPSLFWEEGFHLGLPTAAYSFFHTGAGPNLIVDGKTTPPLINLNVLEKELSGTNYFNSDFSLQTFKVKWIKPKWSVGLDHEIVFHSNISYPDDLIKLFRSGNQQYIGQSIAIAPTGTVYSYNSYGLSLCYRLPGVALGFRAKLLAGNHFANTPSASATLHTSSDIYQLTLDTDYQFDNVGILTFEEANFLQYNIDLSQPWKLFSQNRGFAFDLGLDFQVSEDFNVALSVLDVGSIAWSEGTKSYQSRGIWQYDGFEFADLFNVEKIDIAGALDSLSNLFSLSEKGSSVTYHLPEKWVGLANYQLNKVVNISLITQYNHARPDPLSVSLMTTGALNDRITIGAMAGNRFGQFNFGLNAVVSHRRWQSFLILDNVLAGLNPIASSNYHIRVGLNLRFIEASFD